MGHGRVRRLIASGLVGVFLASGMTGVTADAREREQTYTAGDKISRGLANVFLGFIEIPRNIHNTTAEDSILAGWTVGIGKGLGWMALRMLVGVYEVVTFPIEEPNHYAPVLEPGFVWDAPGPRVK